jgi:hypothetical protein
MTELTEKTLEEIMGFTNQFSKEIIQATIKILKKAKSEELQHTFCGKPEKYLIVEIDRLRNMMFYEGIIQDNQCFISNAYDLDRFIIEGSFNALVEVAEHLELMLESDNFICKNNIDFTKRNFIDKMTWYNHFKTETKDFTYLVGWNSFTIKSMQTEYNMTWKDSDHIENFPI